MMDADGTSCHVDKDLRHKERVHSPQLALHAQAAVRNILLGLKLSQTFHKRLNGYQAMDSTMNAYKWIRPLGTASDDRGITAPAVAEYGAEQCDGDLLMICSIDNSCLYVVKRLLHYLPKVHCTVVLQVPIL